MKTKRVKIHYRKLDRSVSQFPQKTLSTAIREALSSQIGGRAIGNSVKLRISNVVNAEGLQRVANDVFLSQDRVFGNICLFAPGQMQAFLKVLDSEEHPSLDQVMRAWSIAEAQAPRGHEYLQAMSYWMAIGDHFYQIQHTSLQAKALEEYLTWLLREQAGVILPEHQVKLQFEFDRQQVGGNLGDIKEIEVGGLVPETMPDPASVEQRKGKMIDYEARGSLGDQIAQGLQASKRVLEAAFGESQTKALLESVPADASLEVKVNIGYRAKRRKLDRTFMSDFASGLRNIPDGELRIIGKDGIIKGDDARLSHDMNVRHLSETSSLLDLEHTHEQMLEVHRRFLYDGLISDSNE